MADPRKVNDPYTATKALSDKLNMHPRAFQKLVVDWLLMNEPKTLDKVVADCSEGVTPSSKSK